MDFASLPIIHLMKSKLGYISERQSVLARNVANADTPNYLAQDIAEPDFKAMAQQMQSAGGQTLPMATTNPMHLHGGATGSGHFQVTKRPSTYELNPNGNNVVIEEEMMRVGENQADYQKVLGLYRKTLEMFKTAIGRPGAGA